ncbi:hypothetical protein N8I77_012126 [Diaporthe amygdali]|uniref:Uncharacterized protein n=1 Tax=Phomopsis amygdali TaxID=1214568 RepID=A0AAD9S495_PHOAM|nr:hypothetical protein N8I77_012126 [Diaporthe amygdali]
MTMIERAVSVPAARPAWFNLDHVHGRTMWRISTSIRLILFANTDLTILRTASFWTERRSWLSRRNLDTPEIFDDSSARRLQVLCTSCPGSACIMSTHHVSALWRLRAWMREDQITGFVFDRSIIAIRKENSRMLPTGHLRLSNAVLPRTSSLQHALVIISFSSI